MNSKIRALACRCFLCARFLALTGPSVGQYEHVDNAYDLWNAQEPQIGVGIHPFIEGGYLAFANASMGEDGTGAYMVFLNASVERTDDQIIEPSAGFMQVRLSGFGGTDHRQGSGYVICGVEIRDPYGLTGFVARLDQVGQEIWRRHVEFPGADGSECHRVTFTADGGCNVTAIKFQGSGFSTWLVRFDGFGNEMWRLHQAQVRFGPTMPLTDGGLIAAGSKSVGDLSVGWYGRLDVNGAMVWERQLDLTGPAEKILDIVPVDINGFALLSVIDSTDTAHDWLHHLRYQVLIADTTGEVVWRTALGDYSEFTYVWGIKCVPGIGIIGHGMDMSELGSFAPDPSGYLVGVDLSGENVWHEHFQHVFAGDSLTTHGRFYDVLVDDQNLRLICAGGVTGMLAQQGWLTDDDLWIFSTTYGGCITEECAEEPELSIGMEEQGAGRMRISPNPSASGGSVELRSLQFGLSDEMSAMAEVIGSDGRKVHSAKVQITRRGTAFVGLPKVSTGPYLLRVVMDDGRVLTAPLIIE